ncbi:unnamed protein product [Lactuca saligna]|uniref:PRA1 family protein n=1 Tax=Lactuca saligna TaxID=75948 RepID=A0AA36EA35_LACSI|nr:unnamed protein product [Lactuca saligna]
MTPGTDSTNTYNTTAEILHTIRPWFDDFLSSFTLPTHLHLNPNSPPSRCNRVPVHHLSSSYHLVLISLIVITIVVVVVAGVWWNLFSSILIVAPLVSLNAILRTPYYTESLYGALLSGVDEDGDSR